MKKLAFAISIVLVQIVLSNFVLCDNFSLNLILLPSSARGFYINNTVSTVANVTTTINATTTSNTTIFLKLFTRINVSNSSIAIAEYNSTPPNTTSIGILGLNKFFDISISSSLNSSLSWVLINISYTDSELASSGLDENSLRLYRYNTSSGSWSLVNSGVNNISKYS